MIHQPSQVNQWAAGLALAMLAFLNVPAASAEPIQPCGDLVRTTPDLCGVPLLDGTVEFCPEDLSPPCGSGGGSGGSGPQDSDGDGVPDSQDNCPTTYNPDQANNDGDGYGNACDATPNGSGGSPPPDGDGDGVADSYDNCPSASNAGQADNDHDGVGNACDSTPNGSGGSDPPLMCTAYVGSPCSVPCTSHGASSGSIIVYASKTGGAGSITTTASGSCVSGGSVSTADSTADGAETTSSAGTVAGGTITCTVTSSGGATGSGRCWEPAQEVADLNGALFCVLAAPAGAGECAL